MSRGCFISFEGPEGSGKSTQVQRLISRLQKHDRTVFYTREPGGTRTGDLIREILQHDKAGEPLTDAAEVFLFAASRSQLVRREIRPALERGDVVVSDRFLDSTTAYQAHGRQLDAATIETVNRFAVDGLLPDVTLLLDVPVEISRERLGIRNQLDFTKSDRIEREDVAFHTRVREGYLALAARFPERIHRIDATQDRDVIEQLVWERVQRVLG